MKSFKDYIQEVAQPLSQGERNFKELHGSLEPTNRDMVPGVTDQDFLFKGHARAMDPKTASYETEDEAIKQYDKNLQIHPQTTENDLKQMGEEIKDPLKFKNFTLPPQQGAKKGVKVGGEEQVHVGKYSVAEDYKPPERDIDSHFKKQSKKMQDAINLHLRKGNSYWDSYRKAKVHVKEGWVALGPATKPGEKPKSPFNKLGNPNPGTTIYGDRPELKPSGRSDNRKSAAYDKQRIGEEVELDEKTLTPAEMRKREEIVKAMKRKGADKSSRTYAIATAAAKRVAEEVEMDYEGEMAKAELNAICDKAGVLAEMMSDDMQLEAWLQSKITKAKYMIDSVYDYLMYNEKMADKEEDEMPSQSNAMASNYGSFLTRMGEEVELQEKVTASDYKVGAEKSQFGGYTPYVKHKARGTTMYSGAAQYKKVEHAMGHAHAYLKGYSEAGENGANRATRHYVEKNKDHLYKKDEK